MWQSKQTKETLLQELVTYVLQCYRFNQMAAEYIDKVTEYCKRIAFNSDVYSYA